MQIEINSIADGSFTVVTNPDQGPQVSAHAKNPNAVLSLVASALGANFSAEVEHVEDKVEEIETSVSNEVHHIGSDIQDGAEHLESEVEHLGHDAVEEFGKVTGLDGTGDENEEATNG
jgi:hypothetical protein